MANCYFCKTQLETKIVYRTSICPKCSKDLKICYNCKFYSPGAPYDCKENIDQPIIDKDRSNFCDHFQLANRSFTRNDKVEDAKDNFEALFGDD